MSRQGYFLFHSAVMGGPLMNRAAWFAATATMHSIAAAERIQLEAHDDLRFEIPLTALPSWQLESAVRTANQLRPNSV